MPEIAAAQTAAAMTYAKPHAFLPTGGSNRRAARVQAAALRWLVRMAALLTAAVLVFLIGYILVMGIPNLKPELFAWEYNSENVSLTPALINTVLMTAFSLAISTPLGIFAAIWLVEYAHRGSKLVKAVRVTTETLQGIPSIVYGLFGMLFFVTKLHWGYSMIAGAFTLAIMVLPVIMRTTEEALIAVPDSYREGSFGLGAGKLRTVFTIVLPSAMPGILSGVILATGRIVGETAALIYTASSVAKIPSAALILMGNSDDEYRRTLEEIAAKCGAAERLRFLPPVPVNEIWKYAGAMDVGIMPIENLCLSYYYTLPNKFFENVQSLTPVICSDLPEMHRLVDEYGIGLICEPENVDDLAQCLERMRTDRAFYNSCKQNLLRAKRELCWEREKTVLLDAYRKYLL